MQGAGRTGLGVGGCGGGVCAGRSAFARRLGRAAQAPGQLFMAQIAQLRRQGGQGDFTQAALVVARGKGHQTAPVDVQRRNAIEHGGHAARGHAFGQRRRRAIPDHAQHLALAQRHAHQRARRQGLCAGVTEQVAQRAVRRRVDGHGHRGRLRLRWLRRSRCRCSLRQRGCLYGGGRVGVVGWRRHGGAGEGVAGGGMRWLNGGEGAVCQVSARISTSLWITLWASCAHGAAGCGEHCTTASCCWPGIKRKMLSNQTVA